MEKDYGKRMEEVALRLEEIVIQQQETSDKLQEAHFSAVEAENKDEEQKFMDEEKRLRERLEEFEKESEALQKEVEKLTILAMVEKYAEMVRGYIPFAKELIDNNRDDLVQIIKLMVNAFLDIVDGLNEETSRFSKFRAGCLFTDFTNLKSAGFNEDQAFAIVLARIKSMDYIDILQKGVTKKK
jgi:hypothetical protein